MTDQAVRLRVSLIAFALAAIGCPYHAGLRAPHHLDEAAKMFMPPPGQASLYVYRLGGIYPADYFSIHVTVRAQYVGFMGRRTYLKIDLSPGHHVLSATIRLEKTGAWYPTGADLHLELAADHVYFVRVETRWPEPVDPPTVRLMDEAQGKREMEKCALVSGVDVAAQ